MPGESKLIQMKEMQLENGSVAYYVQHPDFYCDIEQDENGVWSVYFRDRITGQEVYKEKT